MGMGVILANPTSPFQRKGILLLSKINFSTLNFMVMYKSSKVSRPLLKMHRFEIRQFIRFWKLPIYSDQSNKKTNFSRNKVRKQLMPTLRVFFNPQIDTVLLNFAEIRKGEQLYFQNVLNFLLNPQESYPIFLLKKRQNFYVLPLPVLYYIFYKNTRYLSYVRFPCVLFAYPLAYPLPVHAPQEEHRGMDIGDTPYPYALLSYLRFPMPVFSPMPFGHAITRTPYPKGCASLMQRRKCFAFPITFGCAYVRTPSALRTPYFTPFGGTGTGRGTTLPSVPGDRESEAQYHFGVRGKQRIFERSEENIGGKVCPSYPYALLAPKGHARVYTGKGHKITRTPYALLSYLSELRFPMPKGHANRFKMHRKPKVRKGKQESLLKLTQPLKVKGVVKEVIKTRNERLMKLDKIETIPWLHYGTRNKIIYWLILKDNTIKRIYTYPSVFQRRALKSILKTFVQVEDSLMEWNEKKLMQLLILNLTKKMFTQNEKKRFLISLYKLLKD